MGESGGSFDGEIDLPGGSFSRLLLSTDDAEHNNFLSMYPSPSPPPLFSANTPNMLCFGDFVSETQPTQQHHSTGKLNLCNPPISHKRRNGSGQEPGQGSGNNGGSETGNQTEKNGKKKNKQEVGPTRTPSAVHAKRRREKLGERITTLQQLVSPYGKTDTASVLHEAMGYIRFLQEQVKVLSSPYLERLSSSSPPHHLSDKEGAKWKESTKGLRSRGLCVVPVQCLVDIVNTNGADFWSSAPSIAPSKLKP